MNQILAAIHYQRGYHIDQLINAVCDVLRDRRVQIGGLVQLAESDSHCMTGVNLVDLLSGKAYDIWEDRGSGAESCRLSEESLANAENALKTAIAQRVELLVVNRFGRAESEGRGMRQSFASAMSAGIPILTAVREPYLEGWRAFHGGTGCELPCDETAIIQWALTACRKSGNHAKTA